MCRLVLYLGEPASPAPLVFGGSHSLYEQSWRPREMLHGSVNADGWGVAWYPGRSGAPEAGPVRLAGTRPIWQEEGLEALLAGLRSRTIMAAIRNATPGIPPQESGVAPLVLERWAFVLNGFVEDFRARFMRPLRRDLPDDLYGRLRGTSDTETLFLLAVSALRRGASPGDALVEVVERVRSEVEARGGEAQLTLALTDGGSAAGVRTSTVDDTNSLYLCRGPAAATGGTVLASEPLDDHDWSPVEPHTLVEVDGDGEVRSRGL